MPELKLASLLALATLLLLGAGGRLEFLAREFPSPSRRVIALLLLLAVLATCVFHPAVSAGAAQELDPDLLWFPGLFAGHLVLAVFLILWWRLGVGRSPGEFLLLGTLDPADIGRGLRLGAVGWLMTIAASALLGGFSAALGAGTDPLSVPPVFVWLVGLPVWQKLLVVAAAMTVEEAFFRAFLQTRIGWVASSLLFALAHASYGMPVLLGSVFVFSLVLGSSLRRTGRLLPCIVAHGLFDAIQLLVVLPWAVDLLGGGPA